MAETKKPAATTEVKEPTVRIRLPLLEGDDTENIDQTENITVNGSTLLIKRGELVDVPVPYYLALRATGKYNV